MNASVTSNVQSEVGQLESRWDVAVDVSKDSLSWYGELPRGPGRYDAREGKVGSGDAAILEWLGQLTALARQQGYGGVRIICEPTGGYERRLLRAARQCGCATALVNGEAVSKMQVVESNDTGKSDAKDPRTILLLAKWNKTLVDRELKGEWLLLRELNARYDRLERDSTRCKNRIHRLLVPLFGELSFRNEWVFNSAAALAVVQLYGLNAAAIVAEGRSRFAAKLRRRRVRNGTIARLWRDAQRSVLVKAEAAWLELMADEQLYVLRPGRQAPGLTAI